MIKLSWYVDKWEFSLVPKVCEAPKFFLKLLWEMTWWCGVGVQADAIMLHLLNQGNTLGPRIFGVSNPICHAVMLRRSLVAPAEWVVGDICKSRGARFFQKEGFLIASHLYDTL